MRVIRHQQEERPLTELIERLHQGEGCRTSLKSVERKVQRWRKQGLAALGSCLKEKGITSWKDLDIEGP
jgi:hypothetical protein